MNEKKPAGAQSTPAQTVPARTTPAQKVISIFGGVRATARILGRNGSTVSRWQKPRAEGGTGGRIPTSAQGPLLEHARANGLPLTADDLIA